MARTLTQQSHGAAGVCIGRNVASGDDVTLRYEDRDLGVAIIGKSRTGKSCLMEHLILADIKDGTPGLVIDPHGRMADRVISLAPSFAAGHIALLDPSEGKPFGLNLLACREPIPDKADDPVTWAADSVVETVKKLYGEADEYLPRFETYLNRAARTLIPSGLTLADAPRLFEDEDFQERCLAQVPNERGWQDKLRRRWRAYNQLRPVERSQHLEAVVNRLERMLDAELIEAIVGSRRTTVPFDEILNGDTMLIVRLPYELLGQERCNFIGALLLCTFADRIFARSLIKDPPRVHLYLDEYQRFATTTTVELLTQGRKFGAGVTLAHQDLYQITDVKIRSAARHAGSLIVLSVTRPDADLLAGEFPVKPREEWIETIEEVDGTEPKLGFSPTPATDIYTRGHTSEEVILAAERLFERPPGFGEDSRVQLSADAVDELLADAMAGRLSSPEALLEALLAEKIWLRFGNVSPDIIKPPDCDCSMCRDFRSGMRLDRPTPRRPLSIWEKAAQQPCRSRALTAEERQHNKAVQQAYAEEQQVLVEKGLRQWLIVHLRHSDALRSGEYIEQFRMADRTLEGMARMRSWEKLVLWRRKMGTHLISLVLSAREDDGTFEVIDCLRQRVRWLFTLCKGLEREPIYVQTGEQQPRRRTSHIVHPRQTEQDALNEFARKLVYPREEYVAHVRLPLPGRCHEVKLLSALAGLSNQRQVDDIRSRSRKLYSIKPDETLEPEAPRSATPPTEGRPPITRRPPNDRAGNPKNFYEGGR